jgi:single-strand DNA-binding protein
MNNQFNLIGRLTKEPILKSTSTGKSVCEINLAVNNGKDDTSFIQVSFWNKLAETINNYCKKGDLLGVQGIIKNHNWEDKNGNKHYDYTFIGNKISFLATKNAQKSENIVQKKEDNTHIFEEFGEQVSIDDFLD